MELLYFEDCKGDTVVSSEAPSASNWTDKDDTKGTVKILKNRQRKLLGTKNSKELHKKTLSKQLSRFHSSFQTGTVLDTFESGEVIQDAEDHQSSFKLSSKLVSKSHIKTLSTSLTSTFLTTSYKAAALYSIHDTNPSLLSDISLNSPFDKGYLCDDSSSALFYGNSNGVAIFDVVSGSFSLCRKLHSDSKVKFNDIKWSKQGHSISAITSDATLMLFDDRIFKPTSSALRGVSAVSRSWDDSKLFVGMNDGTVHLFDLRANDVTHSYSSDFGKVTSICQISGSDCFVGHDSGFISFCQDNQIQPSKSFGNFTTSISDIDIDPTTGMLLSCSEESFKAAKVMNTSTNTWRHLSTSLVVPSHIRFSKILRNSSKFILGSSEHIFIYTSQ